MTQISFPFPSLSKDDERLRTLVKVYSLLIKLAEEAENCTTPSDINPKEEKVEEPTSTTFVPLQNNIPS